MSVNNYSDCIYNAINTVREVCKNLEIPTPIYTENVARGCLEEARTLQETTFIRRHFEHGIHNLEPYAYIENTYWGDGSIPSPYIISEQPDLGVIASPWTWFCLGALASEPHYDSNQSSAVALTRLIALAIGLIFAFAVTGAYCGEIRSRVSKSNLRLKTLEKSINQCELIQDIHVEGLVKNSLSKAFVLEKSYNHLEKIKLGGTVLLTISLIVLILGTLLGGLVVGGVIVGAAYVPAFSIILGLGAVLLLFSVGVYIARHRVKRNHGHLKLACEVLLPLSEIAHQRSEERFARS